MGASFREFTRGSGGVAYWMLPQNQHS